MDTPQVSKTTYASTTLAKHMAASPPSPPFSEWVDWGATSHVADLILEDNFNQTETTALESTLIRHMQKQTDLDAIANTITTNEWKGKLKNWPESTSTSVSGFHLSHSKILITPHDLNKEDPNYDKVESQHDSLIQWQVDLLNLAITHAYSFNRWKTIANVMLLKEPCNFKIQCLQVIQLYEHDSNLLLAIKWWHMIHHCTQHSVLHPMQYGGLLGNNVVGPTIVKELQ